MARTASSDIRRWARLGAEQRLNQLAQEMAAIRAAFPGLGRGRRASTGESSTSTAAAPRKRRRRLSAEARKRISDAQKARWAKQRAGKKR